MMTIPIYRHNQNHDDWEVASVYDSDDCDSLGRSACDESVYSSRSVDGPTLHLRGHHYDDARPHVRYSVPQQQHQNYAPAAFPRPRWETRYVPRKQNNFIVPPPGVIFPSKDLALPPPQDTHWPSMSGQIAPSLDRPVNAGLIEPPPSSLLLSPSSPPCASSRLPSPPMIAHGQSPLTTPITVTSTGTGTKINTHTSPVMPSPPRYHEPAPNIPSRLAEAGCQAHSGMTMSPPRRSGHDVLSSSSPYATGPGRASMLRGPESSEEMTVVEGRYGAGHTRYGPSDRPDLHPLPSKYEYERDHDGAGQTRTAKPQTQRERRPSMWRRFLPRRFIPSHVSVGQT